MTFLEFIKINEMAMPTASELSNKNIVIRIEKASAYRRGLEIIAFNPSTKQKIGQLTVVDTYNDNIWNIHSKVSPDYRGQGYGALLYDVCIEYITSKYNGITMSTYGNNAGSTSDAAESIWKYYYNNRSDVKVIGLKGRKKVEEGENPNPKSAPWLWAGFQKSASLINTLKKNKILKI